MKRVQPREVFDPKAYAQCVRVGDTLYLSGQVALDVTGQVVGRGDARAQAEFIWTQIDAILRSAGGGPENIAKVTTYVTDMAYREAAMEARKLYFGEHLAASTLIGVTALARPDFLIEIEVVAVLGPTP